jgi:Flp pilus assembly protein TadD
MMVRALVLAFLALAWLALPAAAGQEDTRLDGLLARLQSPASPAEARAVEAMIWDIWHTYDGETGGVRQHMSAGLLAMNHRDLATAEQEFDEVVLLAPDFAEGWNRRATVRYLRDDYVGSVEDIRATLALEPRHFGALSGLGLCYTALGDLPQALAAFEAALGINPNMPGVRANIDMIRKSLSGDPI